MKRDAVFKKQLLKLANASLHPRSHHAALVAQGNEVIGEGRNNAATHAEIRAIDDAMNRGNETFAGVTLYTLMVKARSGQLGNGTPCSECMGAIRAAGIRKVVVYV